jgi:hypothetical protein
MNASKSRLVCGFSLVCCFALLSNMPLAAKPPRKVSKKHRKITSVVVRPTAITPIVPVLTPAEPTRLTPALTATEQFYRIAKQSKQIGDPHPRLAAAQWALESGWGKLPSEWGDVASGESRLPELLKDRLDRFRAPQYASYWTVTTPQEAAQVLQEAQSTNDIAYAQKLTRIVERMYGTPNMVAVATVSERLPLRLATTESEKTTENEETASLAWPEGLRTSLTSPRVIPGRVIFDGKGITAKTANGRWWVDVRGRIFHASPSSEEAFEVYLPWNTAEKNILGLEPEETGQGVRVIGKLGTLTIIPDQPTRFGYEGYIRARLGEETETLPEGVLFARMATEMATWLGTPYKYGGTTKLGCDCSGFVGSVYRTIGISTPRTSDDIGKMASKVDINAISELRFGDLLCYPGHVAIYLGNGQTIEALGTPEKGGKVQKHHIWNRENVTVKRLLP